MTAYFLVYGWILTISTLLYIKKIEYRKARNWFCALSFLAVFLLFALKHPFSGGDLRYGHSSGYLAKFCKIATFSWREAFTAQMGNFERGYILFNKFLAVFSDDHQFFLSGCALVCLLPVWYLIHKQSLQPDLSVYIFMGLPAYSMLFSGLRQAIAISLCAAALLCVVRKKPLWFILTVGFAMTFHKSAAVFFVAYPVYYLKLNKPLRWLSCALPFAVYVLRQPLFAVMGKIYSAYAVPDNNGSYRLFAVFYMIYLFCCVFSDERREICGLKNLFLGACCVQALAGMHSIVMRMGYYFTIPLVLLLPLVVETMENKKLAVFFKAAISVCFIVFGLYLLRTSTWARAYPYYAFWAW